MKILIFDEEQEAIDAEAEISKQMGLPKYGTNAATQELDMTSIQTERWDIPWQLENGKWAITSPIEEDECRAEVARLGLKENETAI